MISDGKNKINVERFIVGPLQTNCYVVFENIYKKSIIIDPGYPDNIVSEYIAANNLDVVYIVNTHGHADHISGNAKLGYPVLIHEKDRNVLFDPMLNLSFLSGGQIDPILEPSVLLKDSDLIRFGNIEIQVIHTPGHTPGCICLKFDDLLFSGDTLFFEGIGRTDCPGGDSTAILKSITEKIMPLDEKTRVFPGHGPETTIGHERDHNPFLIN